MVLRIGRRFALADGVTKIPVWFQRVASNPALASAAAMPSASFR